MNTADKLNKKEIRDKTPDTIHKVEKIEKLDRIEKDDSKLKGRSVSRTLNPITTTKPKIVKESIDTKINLFKIKK